MYMIPKKCKNSMKRPHHILCLLTHLRKKGPAQTHIRHGSSMYFSSVSTFFAPIWPWVDWGSPSSRSGAWYGIYRTTALLVLFYSSKSERGPQAAVHSRPNRSKKVESEEKYYCRVVCVWAGSFFRRWVSRHNIHACHVAWGDNRRAFLNRFGYSGKWFNHWFKTDDKF